MQLCAHDDPSSFAQLVMPLLVRDRARHTVLISVLHSLSRTPPDDVVMLSIHDGPELVGAALRTPPHPLICSAVPVAAAVEVARFAEWPGFTGPTDVVEALVTAAGRAVAEATSMRLFRLDELTTPTEVSGHARTATEDDTELVAGWVAAFATEAGTHEDDPARTARAWITSGTGLFLREADGATVSMAVARPVVAGISRVGPVYTPPIHRGHGHGAAVTATATRWAQGCGADEVVLFTDLDNPIPNRLYPRLGFVAVAEHEEVLLAPS